MANHLIHDKFVGAYVYAIKVDGVVRYIGKGRRYRAIEHLRFARWINRKRATGEKVRALPMHNRLAKAMREGKSIEYDVLAFGLDDDVAYEAERKAIAAAPVGQLWNLKPGGDGGNGDFMRALWRRPEFREKLTAARRKSCADPDFRERQRENANAQWADPEKKRRHYEQHRKLWDNPTAAAERRALLKAVWADPEKTARKKALVKSQWTPERRAAMSENRKRAWANPEFRARATASIRASKAKK